MRGLMPVLVSAASLLLVSGCGDDDGPTAPGPTGGYVAAATPFLAVERFFETYAAMDVDAYDGTLARDFRFTFSAQSDPDLVAQYGNSWDVTLEKTAAQHLFSGFTDDEGTFHPATASITDTMLFASAHEDPTHADSVRHYALVSVPRLLMEIWLADDRGFEFDSPVNIFVVRGDAAVLGAGQAPDSTVWYVRRLDDLTTALGAPLGGDRTMPGTTTSLGRLRAVYAARQVPGGND
jgi:hypothetical protein